MKNPFSKEAREERAAERSIQRDGDGRPVECDCNNWPGPCNGVGMCRREKK